MQEKKILNDDLEYPELEELQGVNGLKALRIGANTNHNTPLQSVVSSQASVVNQ
ncbi:MAG: hypothetical protein Q8941_16915 [Bacteroidota bacterium]|nr:hypothetical protein [Bacteroidota bacterium]